MIFKKKYLIVTIFIILVLNTLLYTSNNQKTSFRYLKWTVKEVSIGKLISISFISGLFMSTFINSGFSNYKKNIYENTEEKYESINNEKDIKSNVEMPPQRDIRDAQPTISVNYRVVKNTDKNNLESERNFSDNPDNKDDWVNNNDDW